MSLENAINYFNGRELAVDFVFGFSKLQEYEHRLEQVKAGIPLREVFGSKDGLKLEILKPLNGEYSKSFTNVTPGNTKDLSTLITGYSIAVINLEGFMSVDDGLCSYGAKSYAELISSLESNEKILALILQTDSGGGEAMAGQIWFDALKQFRSSGKPAIGHAMFAASAAYKANAALTEIIATSRIATFGSTGTMMSYNSKILDLYKNQIMDLYSRKSPKKNYEFRELLKENVEPTLDKLDAMVEIFHELIKDNRPLKGNIEETLEGDVFLAEEAKDRGLIDSIGNIKLVIERVKSYMPPEKAALLK